jgi:hypothetical protein
MALSRQEREGFLAERQIGFLSVVERSDRAPLAVPIWFHYAPGDDLWVRTEPESRKCRAIRSAGRFTMLVQRTRPTERYVSVEGPVTRIAPSTRELGRMLVARYLPPGKVEAFLDYEEQHFDEQVVVVMRPEHWLSSDLGAF